MRWVVMFLVLVGCKGSEASGTPAPSAQASAAPAQATEVLVTRGKWWTVASKSRVYTEDRRVDADNSVRMLAPDVRNDVLTILDDMARQATTAEGLRAASQLARDGQTRVGDINHPAAQKAVAQAGYIVLQGLIAQACEHPDAAPMAALLAAIREMPLPRVDKSNGIPERGVLEQEMRMALDDKLMKVLLTSAPAPKKSPL